MTDSAHPVSEAQADPHEPPIRVVGRDGDVTSIESWRTNAGPAGGDKQWRTGRSAMEVARAWCEHDISPPKAFTQLLDSAPQTAGAKIGLVEPEKRMYLDEHRGNTRNTDLLVHARSKAGRVLMAVEAKADESFGPKISNAYEDSPAGSKRPDRIDRLSRLVFGVDYQPRADHLGPLRYQLLHGLGAALLAARDEADVAVFAIHVFRPPDAQGATWTRNRDDLLAFLRMLGREEDPTGHLLAVDPPGISDWKRPKTALIGMAVTEIGGRPNHSPSKRDSSGRHRPA